MPQKAPLSKGAVGPQARLGDSDVPSHLPLSSHLKEGISMLGVLVNTATVILGSLIGLLCKRGIPEKIEKAVCAQA